MKQHIEIFQLLSLFLQIVWRALPFWSQVITPVVHVNTLWHSSGKRKESEPGKFQFQRNKPSSNNIEQAESSKFRLQNCSPTFFINIKIYKIHWKSWNFEVSLRYLWGISRRFARLQRRISRTTGAQQALPHRGRRRAWCVSRQPTCFGGTMFRISWVGIGRTWPKW